MIRTAFIVGLIFSCLIKLYAADILFFNQDCNVDEIGADNSCHDERYNLLKALQAEGHVITLLQSFNNPNLVAMLEANEMIAIPDLEDNNGACNVNLPGFLSPNAKTTLNNYVLNGGRLLIAGSTQNIAFLNDVFSMSLMSGGFTSSGYSVKNVQQADGTPFDICPDTIANLSATFLVTSSMPANKRCIYETSGSASLATFGLGNGMITFFGFDFFDSGPTCSNDGSAWISCGLESAVEELTGLPAFNSIPTMGEWGLIIVALLLMILGVNSIKSASLSRVRSL